MIMLSRAKKSIKNTQHHRDRRATKWATAVHHSIAATVSAQLFSMVLQYAWSVLFTTLLFITVHWKALISIAHHL